jgi:hypothetical protein
VYSKHLALSRCFNPHIGRSCPSSVAALIDYYLGDYRLPSVERGDLATSSSTLMPVFPIGTRRFIGSWNREQPDFTAVQKFSVALGI